jgi:cytochrome oxidase Cu insertion factor (SCO1/SenC/PrrC family)
VRWLLLCAAVVVAAGTGGLVYVARSAPKAETPQPQRLTAINTWGPHERRAPALSLADPQGAPLSLAALRGQTAVVTFIDPVCRNLCPLEAKVLMRAVRSLPAAQRPVVVAVSVNPWANTRANFAVDKTHWQLGNEWRWAVGSGQQLAAVWRRFQIAVQVQKKVVAGVTVRSIAHTEASFVVDRNGYERAVFLYPFTAKDVAQTLRDVAA